jgi:phosphopantothenoylcysteine decarboxylase/phosphopantothenate--cysteine ligase
MARILLGVSGGIAAYKAVEFARLATQAGHGVRVLMTKTASRFVGAATFEGIVGAPVLTNEFERDPMRGGFPGEPALEHDPIGHLELAARCDAMLIAPASANTIAKLAAGICDSMLTTSFLACDAPRIVAPAMNDRMWADAATRANVATLRERGIDVLEPAAGALASRGEKGRGRLAEPVELLEVVESAVKPPGGPWDGLDVLVTAGGTREPIDSVRFIGNRSSGRMGFALAEEAARRGARVTVVAANVALPTPRGVDRIDVETAAELAARTTDAFPRADILLMAAAVADFRPQSAHGGKLAREGSGGLELHLEETEDVLASIAARRRPGQVLIGFAAEHGPEAIDRARAKLERKGADAIVFNDVSRSEIGFDSADNEVTVVTATSEAHIPLASKPEVAAAILDQVSRLRVSTLERDG